MLTDQIVGSLHKFIRSFSFMSFIFISISSTKYTISTENYRNLNRTVEVFIEELSEWIIIIIIIIQIFMQDKNTS